MALLSIKERKLVLLASQHLYPVLSVKWMPSHDFLLVATEDGSVHIWEMETGKHSVTNYSLMNLIIFEANIKENYFLFSFLVKYFK